MSSHVSKTYCLFWKVISIRMLFFFLLYGHQPQWRLRYTFKSSLLGFVSRRNYSKLRFPGVNFIIFSLASFALILRWSYKVTTYLERKKKNTKVGRNFYLFVMVELCINKLVKLTPGLHDSFDLQVTTTIPTFISGLNNRCGARVPMRMLTEKEVSVNRVDKSDPRKEVFLRAKPNLRYPTRRFRKCEAHFSSFSTMFRAQSFCRRVQVNFFVMLSSI